MDLAVRAHSVIGHDNLALAERLVELDDVYDTLEYTDLTEQEVNDDVLAEARRIAERPSTIWPVMPPPPVDPDAVPPQASFAANTAR